MHRLIALLSLILVTSAFSAEPLRIFIRSGPKSHGPGAHDHPSFLRDWVPMLNERGAKCEGGDDFPTKDQLAHTDVLVIHRDGGGDMKPDEQAAITEYAKRGGGIVVIHAGSVANTPEGTEFYKHLIGGSWLRPTTKWLEAPMSLYFTDHENPITKGISNFDIDDEMYYDMDILPEVKVLAAAYTPKSADTGGKGNKEAQQRAAEAVAKGKAVNIYDIQPQMWTYERSIEGSADTPVRPANQGGEAAKKDEAGKSARAPVTYRAFVCIPGHYYANFSHDGLRTAILRGIAWAGKRENADLLCKPAELGDALRYPPGGCPRPQDMPQHLEVHPEFNISLVASEPLINKPMNVDWDEKGRLWVVETPEYPNGRKQQNTDPWKDSGSLYPGTYNRDPQDKISCLTDTDGDGVMDKKHVFADKLELCTSFCFYKYGVIACAAPDIWLLEDTDGDEVADKRTKLYTNLGTRDTHAVINNLRWGLDGWVYATQGYSSTEDATSGDGSKHFGAIGSGVVRFKPDGSAIEQYCSRGGNTWGLDITWDGQVFYTQPTSGVLFHHVVLPEYILAKGKLPGVTSSNGLLPHEPTYPAMHWEQQAYVQIDQVGSYTAGAGCAIYEGGAWPAKWDYSYFTTEPTLNIVSQFMVEPDGVTYKAHREAGREQTEFIRSNNLWFRPIEVRVGPDGALYIVDFCNQAVIHNDTRGPLHGPANAAVRPDRDHYFGRIWKVQHKEAKKLEVPVLDKKDLASLVETMATSPNAATKQAAFRLVHENFRFYEIDALYQSIEKERERAPNQTTKNQKLLLLSAMTPLRILSQGEMYDQEKLKYGGQPAGVPVARQADDLANTLESVPKDFVERKMLTKEMIQLFEGLGGFPKARAKLLDVFAGASNPWTKSAAIAATSGHSVEYLTDCLVHEHGAVLKDFVAAVLPTALQQDVAANSASLLSACAAAPSSADEMKSIILKGLGQQTELNLATTPGMKAPLQKLLANPATAALALPLVAEWDTKGEMADVVKAQVAGLSAKLNDKSASTSDRINAAKALIGVGGDARRTVVPALAGQDAPAELQAAIIEALSENGDVAELVGAYARLKPELQNIAFDAILKRPESTLALLDLVESGKIKPADLGPSNVARLRTHPNKRVATRANKMLEKLSPTTVAKNQIIAQLAPEVEKPGDAAKGKLFFAACAVCHKLGDIGASVGPPLDGIGAHGPAELLVHIVDPNREVDPSFWAQNIITKKGDALVGVITSENASTVTLATQLGVKEIAKTDIATRENTRRSLMPEGLEALGAETLRDILAFICGDALKHFRIVDLRPAYTADSREGVFASSGPKGGVVRLAKYGNVTVSGIPFFIQDSAKSATGSNIIVLKGGPEKSQSWTYPQRVEVAVNAEAKKLHLLSGIAGWGFPAVREQVPAVKFTVNYASGEKEEFTTTNGVEFADYIRPVEVPGSQFVEEPISDDQQVRLLTLTLTKKGVVKTLAMESGANGIAPVIVAVTADVEGKMGAKPGGPATAVGKGKKAGPKKEADGAAKPGSAETGPKEGGKGDAPLAPVTAPAWESGKTKVLIIGGGSSHNFAKFMGEADSATLKAAGFSTHYTEDRDQAASEIKDADVAIVSVNRKFFDTPAYRKALFDFVAAGKGLIMLHPGTWYGFAEWPELNAQIVGGGARGHDKLGPFTVSVVAKDHPVMKGVPASFGVTDELYYVNAEADKIPEGTASIEVLAQTSPSQKFGKPHPSVWVTKHDKARIVGIALGHDERVHDLGAYKSILTNAVKWVESRK